MEISSHIVALNHVGEVQLITGLEEKFSKERSKKGFGRAKTFESSAKIIY